MITILALIYLAVSAKLLFHIPMVKYSHLAIDACLFIFWLIAAATASTVFLEDLCGICGYRYYLDFFDDLSGAYDFTCCCVNFDSCCDSQYVFWKRQLLGQRSSGKSSNTKNTQSSSGNAGKKAGSAGSKWAARKGLDAVLWYGSSSVPIPQAKTSLTCVIVTSSVLFFITLVAVAYFIWSGRHAKGTATTTPRNDTKVTDPAKDGIGMEHQAQPVSAPAPQYTAQQPDYGIQHDQTGVQQTNGIHHDQMHFQQTEANLDHTQDPYQAMQPGFEPHQTAHGHTGHQDNSYAGV